MKSQENESGKPYRSLRKRHAAVSGISVPSERNLQERSRSQDNKQQNEQQFII